MAESREEKPSSKSSLGSNGTVAELRALAAKANTPTEKKATSHASAKKDSIKRRTGTTTTTAAAAADKRGKADGRTATRKVCSFSHFFLKKIKTIIYIIYIIINGTGSYNGNNNY